MSDNIPVTPGSGVNIAGDDIGGVLHQRVKVVLGNDGISDGDVSSTNPMPIFGTVTANTGLTQPLTDAQLRASAVPVSGTFYPTTQPVSATSLPLPSGAATETTLSGLNTKVTTTLNGIKVDGSAVTQPISGSVTATISGTPSVSVSNFPATQAISAASLPLPSGAATSVLQTSGNSSLSSIDTKTPALGQALAASSVPVVLPASQITTLTPPSTVTVTQSSAANLNATVTGSVNANITNGSIAVTGPLTDTQLRATAVPVSGSVTANAGTGTFAVSASTLPLPTGAATSALQTTGNSSLSSIDSKTPSLGQALMASSTPVVIASNQTAIPVTGSFTSASGTLSTANSTATALTAAGVFTGTSEDTLQYASIAISVYVDQSGSLSIQFSSNNTNWDDSDVKTITITTPGTPEFFAIQVNPESRYFRLVYTNGATTQGVFRLQTILKSTPASTEIDYVGVVPSDDDSAATVKSVIYGKTSAGNQWVGVKVTPSGSLTTAIGDISGIVGQNTMSNSLPVVIASNQSTLPMSAASLPLPTGAATETTLSAGLATIHNDLTANTNDFTSSGTITALNGSVSITGQGTYTTTFSLTGTFVATLVVEAQASDSTWYQIPFYTINTTTPWSQSTSTTTTGFYGVVGGGYQNIRVRASAFTSGTVNVSLDSSLAQQSTYSFQAGPWAFNAVPVDGNKASYSAAASFAPVATTPTDIFSISGSATKTIRITRVEIVATQTTAAMREILFLKRSTASSNNGNTAVTPVAHDSNNAASTATIKFQTANPSTLGNLVGTIKQFKMWIPTTAAQANYVTFDFATRPEQAIVLRGIAESFCINLNSVASAGNSFDICITYTEE